jgi:serine/threonine protein kinase
MGTSHPHLKSKETPQDINKMDFVFDCIIGKGGFGRVWRVEHRSLRRTFALKEMDKAKIIDKRSVNSVLNERKLLAKLKHPFIVNMQYAFQDLNRLFLVMDLMPGGDLRYHLGKHRTFNEETTKFFIACIVTSLEFLHLHGIIHRDIKPENLVLDSRGYLRLTDFGIAMELLSDNSADSSGTPGYMAPEVMCRQSHGPPVDWFAMGVIAFEAMKGFRPYRGKNRAEIREQILSRQVQLRRSDIPEGWSIEAADFINKLLQRKPQHRLGFNGVHEIKNHAWLRDFPWKRLFKKQSEAPFKPPLTDNFKRTSLFEFEEMPKSSIDINERSIQELFAGYVFNVNCKLSCESTVSLERSR